MDEEKMEKVIDQVIDILPENMKSHEVMAVLASVANTYGNSDSDFIHFFLMPLAAIMGEKKMFDGNGLAAIIQPNPDGEGGTINTYPIPKGAKVIATGNPNDAIDQLMEAIGEAKKIH